MKKTIRNILIILACAVLCGQPVFASRPKDEILDMFDQNGIYYYNPSGTDDLCGSTSTKLEGSDLAEKMWNYLIENGFNDAQAAGILGNAYAETGIEPTRASGSKFWGLFQWAYERKDGVFQKLREAGLERYTSQEYWPSGAYKNIPEADLDRILQIELDFAISEDSRHWKEEIKKQTTPEAAAEVFLVLFERAVNGNSEIIYYTPYLGIKYQGAERRRNYAREYYEKYSGKGVSVNNSQAELGSDLSLIGDSISVYAHDAIMEIFPELKEETYDARSGRKWDEGTDIAKGTALKSTVIFALGTNSPNLSEERINAALQAIGPNKKIILTTNYSTDDEHLFDTNNAAFKKLAEENSNIFLADWNAAVREEPNTYMKDHLHPNDVGQKLFAQTLYDAVNSNINDDGCSINSEFTNLVKAYAWPDYHKAPFTDRMPAYAEAVTTSISEKRYVGGSINGIPGIDCGGFVTILVQNSGLEPNYNDTKGGTDNQEAWVKSHGWTLLNATPETHIDTSVLQPGDVAFSLGHTFIYVGEIPGFNSVIASASYGQSTARAPMAGHEDLVVGARSLVRWYRNPNRSTSSIQNTVYNENKQ